MSKSGLTIAQQNKRIRQEALREQLSKQKHLEHVIEIAKKLSDLDEELDSLAIQRLKAAADIKKGLILKYLPDLKQTEFEGTIDITAHEAWLDSLD